MEWSRNRAVNRLETLVETVETDLLPVPIREIWVFGPLALGVDPLQRIDVYLTKDILLKDESGREQEFIDRHGIEGVGKTVRAAWAERYPEHLRAGRGGYAAPEKCLGAHLVGEDEPIHLEICNASFDDNVTQRARGAQARETYEQVLDPRGVCLWAEGKRSETAFEKLRTGEYVFPTLPDALSMLGLSEEEAATAATAVNGVREAETGRSVRGDVL